MNVSTGRDRCCDVTFSLLQKLIIPKSCLSGYEQPEKHVIVKGREAHSSGDEEKKQEKENFSDA